jgi:DNA-binding transcriptional LysR family regulator
MTIDAYHLTCLLTIARTGSFSRAAVELGQSQPTLSNNIALLERRLGVRVLDRSKRGSTLTRHGKILVRRADGLATMLADAETEVRNLDHDVSGPLRIGATPSVLPALLPAALERLRVGSGAIAIEVVEGLDQRLGPMLLTGKLDAIVSPVHEPFTEMPDVVETPLLIDPLCVAVGAPSRLSDRAQVGLDEIADENWVLPREGSTYRRHVEALFLTANVAWPRNVICANSLHLLEAMVADGTSVTIVSPVQIRSRAAGLHVLRLDGGSHRRIGFKTRRSGPASPIAEAFLASLSEAASQLADDFADLGLVRIEG